MKKHFSLLLALCLMLGIGQAALAQTPGDYQDILFENDSIASVLQVDGEILVQTGSKLVVVTPGEEGVKPYKGLSSEAWMEAQGIGGFGGTLLTDGKRLLMFNFAESKLIPLTVEDGKVQAGEPIELDLSSRKMETGGVETFFQAPEQVELIGDRLYFLYRDMAGEDELLSLSLQGGELRSLKAKGVRSFAAYKDGKLLVVTDPSQAAGEAGRVFESGGPVYDLSVLNPEDNSLTKLGATVPSTGGPMPIGYDAKMDSIYFLAQGALYRWQADGKPVLCAYAGSSSMWRSVPGNLSLLPDGRILMAGTEVLSIRSVDPERLPKGKLVIYGSHESTVHRKATQTMQGMPVRFLDTKYFSTAQELGQALLAGEDEIDLFFLQARHTDLGVLKSKGYCHDLSQSESLKRFVAETYPMIQAQAEHQGKLSLIPVDVSSSMMHYNSALFSEIGIEPPKTFKEFCELIVSWDEKYAERFPNYLPVSTDDYPSYLMTLALNLYADYCAATGEEWSFRSPLLRELLEQAEAVRKTDIGKPVDWTDPQSAAMIKEVFSKQELFSQTSVSLRDSGMMTKLLSLKPLRLQVKEGVELPMASELMVMAINPKSKNLENAVKYAEAYVAALDGASRLALSPGLNDPVPNPDFEAQRQQMESVRQMLKKAVDEAQGAELTEQKRMLAEFESNYDTILEQMRYLVNAESITNYREQMQRSYVRTYGPVETLLNQEEMQNLMRRYQQAQISLDQFLMEAEGKFRLIRLENQ